MSIEMRGKEFSSMVVTATTAVAAGELMKVEDTVGVAFSAISEGASGVMVYECDAIEVAKAAVAMAVGEKIYLDETNKVVTTVSTDNTLCGRVKEDAADTASVVIIDLKGYLA